MHPWAYLNGNWIPESQLSISVHDVGFLLGATVTERLRTFQHKVFRLDEHLSRLRHSLEIVDLRPDEITSQIAAAIPEFIDRNKSLIAADDDWSILAFATPGISGAGQPTVCVHGYPLPFARWAPLYEEGVRVVISDVQQIPPQSLPPELKCRSRMHFYLADHRAQNRRGLAHFAESSEQNVPVPLSQDGSGTGSKAGARAILLDEDGYIAEATTANVFIYREAEGLVSPPPEHILFGVSLGVVQELAAKLNIPFITRPLTVAELRSANEAILTSTSVCVLPIVVCNDKPIGPGAPGPVFHQLLTAWSDLVGVDIAEQSRSLATRRG
jgi:branched-subunit amino acid aminotransferase/4-amino-4-deoxychorismate lyase